MTPQVLHRLLENLEARKKVVKQRYAQLNNPVKEGDVISDEHTTIRVREIGFNLSMAPVPTCYYTGPMVKKDGTPFKSPVDATIWQENLITN